jgi:hypothetical protein
MVLTLFLQLSHLLAVALAQKVILLPKTGQAVVAAGLLLIPEQRGQEIRHPLLHHKVIMVVLIQIH